MRSYLIKARLEGLEIICIANTTAVYVDIIEDGVCLKLPANDRFLGRLVSTYRRSCGIGSQMFCTRTVVRPHKLHVDYCAHYVGCD